MARRARLAWRSAPALHSLQATRARELQGAPQIARIEPDAVSEAEVDDDRRTAAKVEAMQRTAAAGTAAVTRSLGVGIRPEAWGMPGLEARRVRSLLAAQALECLALHPVAAASGTFLDLGPAGRDGAQPAAATGACASVLRQAAGGARRRHSRHGATALRARRCVEVHTRGTPPPCRSNKARRRTATDFQVSYLVLRGSGPQNPGRANEAVRGGDACVTSGEP